MQYSILRSLERGNGSIAGITFNSQRLSEEVLALFDQMYADAASDRISNFVVGNDPVSGWEWLGNDLLGKLITLGDHCSWNIGDFCLIGRTAAHSITTVINMLDGIFERQCGNQSEIPGGNGGGAGGAGSSSGDNGGGGTGSESGGTGSESSGTGSGSGGTGSGTGEGKGTGDDDSEDGDGKGTPSVGMPLPSLPDFGIQIVDGTLPWDKLVGFSVPYSRVTYLLSGDVPDGRDAAAFLDEIMNFASGQSDVVKEFKDMWKSIQSIDSVLDDSIEKRWE